MNIRNLPISIKTILFRLLIVTIIILIIPLIINKVILLPAMFDIVGEGTDWLSFWGAYLGSIITAIVAFVILYIQRKDNEKQNLKNREENIKQHNANRKLQYNILKHQQEQSNLNDFIIISSKLIAAINPLEIRTLCKKLCPDNVIQIENEILTYLNNISRIEVEFYLHLSETDNIQKKLGDDVKGIVSNFANALIEIQHLLTIIEVSPIPVNYDVLKEIVEEPKNNRISKYLRECILNYKPNETDNLKLEYIWEGIIFSLLNPVVKESDNLYKIIDEFVLGERNRINNILKEEEEE